MQHDRPTVAMPVTLYDFYLSHSSGFEILLGRAFGSCVTYCFFAEIRKSLLDRTYPRLALPAPIYAMRHLTTSSYPH